MVEKESRFWPELIGLISGPLVAAAFYFLLPGDDSLLPPSARAAAAVGTLMAVWWMTEAVPLAVTSLLPIVLFPVLGVYNVPFKPGEIVSANKQQAIFLGEREGPSGETLIAVEVYQDGEVVSQLVPAKKVKPQKSPIDRTVAPYAHRYIYLFFGGFLIALAIENTGLHRRIALNTLNFVGPNPRFLIGGFMLATGFLSMWISNTAATVMMVPIALSLVELLRANQSVGDDSVSTEEIGKFACCLLLCVAYSASVGGIGSLVGTPTNTFLVGFLKEKGTTLDFAQWMLFALPFSVTFNILIWIVMTRFTNRFEIPTIPGGRQLIRDQLTALGQMSRGEKRVLVVFVGTALCWILRGILSRSSAVTATVPFITRIDDSVIAMASAILLFITPVGDSDQPLKRILSWEDAKRLPWGILLLFGGGLTLAQGVDGSGLANYISHSVSALEGSSTLVLVMFATAVVVFMTELTSNTPTATLFMPLLFQIAGTITTAEGSMNPMYLLVPTTMAASCAFMLPVATPPNAIVFGSGHISIRQMAKAGLWLNLLAILLIPLFVLTWGRWVLIQ